MINELNRPVHYDVRATYCGDETTILCDSVDMLLDVCEALEENGETIISVYCWHYSRIDGYELEA